MRKRRRAETLAALVRRSPLSPTEMLRTSFWTLISRMGFESFFSEACNSNQVTVKNMKQPANPLHYKFDTAKSYDMR